MSTDSPVTPETLRGFRPEDGRIPESVAEMMMRAADRIEALETSERNARISAQRPDQIPKAPSGALVTPEMLRSGAEAMMHSDQHVRALLLSRAADRIEALQRELLAERQRIHEETQAEILARLAHQGVTPPEGLDPLGHPIEQVVATIAAGLLARCNEAQAQAAAMRQQLLAAVEYHGAGIVAHEDGCPEDADCRCAAHRAIERALSGDAGRDLLAELDRLRKALRCPDCNEEGMRPGLGTGPYAPGERTVCPCGRRGIMEDLRGRKFQEVQR